MPALGDRILIVKPSSLGDIVHGLQVADAIKAQKPATHITWVAASTFAPLVQACPVVDDTLVFERQAGLRGLLRVMAEIRRRRFDQVLDLQGLARSGLMTLAARCPRRHKLGRRDAREGASLACGQTMPLPPTGKESHALAILMECLPLLGLEKKLGLGLTFAVESPSPELASAQGKPLLLFPSSRRAEKEWPGFAELARTLCESCPERTVVWSDSRAGEQAHPAAANFLDLSGKTTLSGMVGLIQSAALVVCNDSGPLHIAAALGIPVVALFGPTDPRRYGPWPLESPKHRVLQAPGGKLADLDVATVHEAVRALSAEC